MQNLIIVVNKDKGYTSRDVVNKLTKILNNKKIGHTGTLDPIATGVLVCVTGKYTKLVDLITSLDKEYIAEIKLGIKTDTLDITGNVIDKKNIKEYSKNEIVDVLNSFIGTYMQSVPKYSAVSINGKRLYEYARNNEEVSLPKREVTINKIELLDYHKDTIKFKVNVSKGTYIRSLIEDICDKLNTIGTMSSLIRTKQGKFTINNSYTLKDIENNNYKSLNIEDVLDLNTIELNDFLYKKVINGNVLDLEYNGYILFKKDSKDIALYYFEKNIGTLKILF